MVNDWLLAMDDSEIIGSVTVDLRKAFDILNHDIILQKLDLYECHESKVQWFTCSSYLKRYSHAIWDKKFMFNIRVDY